VKICIAATTFPRWAGDGEGAFVWGLTRTLQEQGLDLRVVALHSPGAATRETIEGIEVILPRYLWPTNQESLRKGGGGLPVTLRKYPLARVQLAPFLAVYGRAIAKTAAGCDVVHAHWTLSGAVALATQRWHRCPVVVTVQGSDVLQIPKLPMGAAFTRWVLMNCQQVTALTQALKAAVVGAGVPGAQVEVIANGVDLARFTPPADGAASRAKVILFAGFLIERKGVRSLLDAAPAILAQLPDYRIVLVGSGPEEETLRAQAAALGIAHAVEFCGFVPQEEVRSWMQQARVLVLPSHEEGQGVVLLEALASGTPVVGSDVDGIAEVVTPEVGALFSVGDVSALAAAVVGVLEDESHWQRLSLAARQRAVAHYDWNVLARRFRLLYESLV